MKRLLIVLGFRIGDPFDWEPTPWTRLRFWARRFRRKPNATCNACGYRGVRTRRGRWCPSCYEDEGGGELIRDRSSRPVVTGERFCWFILGSAAVALLVSALPDLLGWPQ